MKTDSIDTPSGNDNRNYDYSAHTHEVRAEYGIIRSFMEPGSKVLDLGSGNGTLLQILRDELSCDCTGVEISGTGVEICRTKGLSVIQGSIDELLPFADKSFDTAVCNVTLQMVNKPEVVLSEIKRVARHSIISFPNFGYYKNRLQLLVSGKMPDKMLFGYTWYNTGHIHQFGVRDFVQYLDKSGMKIEQMKPAPTGSRTIDTLGRLIPSLFAYIPVYYIKNVE